MANGSMPREKHSAVAPIRPAGSRIAPIDATRGLAMMFSCLSHFGWWLHSSYPYAGSRLGEIGMVATPTFLLTSGAMVGMLCTGAAQAASDLKSQLFNRGLFLLTIGHLLISVAESTRTGGILKAIYGASVVDEIGLCTLIAAFFVPQIANPKFCRWAATIAAAVFLIAWLIVLSWHPATRGWQDIKQILLGGNDTGNLPGIYTAPTLQYMAIYALGLPAGHVLKKYVTGEAAPIPLAVRTIQFGMLLVFIASALRLAIFLIDKNSSLPISPALAFSYAPTHKLPPSPAYLLFFGGFGLIFSGALFWLWQRSRFAQQTIIPWLAAIGKASLFVFILQYFLYWMLPDLLGITAGRWSILLLIANVLIIRHAATFWTNIRGNRWLTFGFQFKPVARTRQS